MDTLPKDPDAVLDYGIDWSDWLVAGDTITASTWTVSGTDNALTLSDPTFTDTQTGMWLSDGTDGGLYRVTNHIVTDGNREDDRSIDIMVTQR